jgi:hypothetical protein
VFWAEECCQFASGEGIIYMLPAEWLMTFSDRNDLMPAQEKLEWVTPKISLMEATTTDGKPHNPHHEKNPNAQSDGYGPS